MAYHIPPSPLPQSYTSSTTTSVQSEAEVNANSNDIRLKPPTSSGRRRSSVKVQGILKRTVSSPNIRSLGSIDSLQAAADKKRNKLGYHRTAVACGHCRRRKIRCVPAFDDANGRCQTCIRLKKDCLFYAVDQQGPEIGRRAKSGSKAEGQTRDRDTSASSSPSGVLGSSLVEQIKQVNDQIGKNPSAQETSGMHYTDSTDTADKQDFLSPDEYTYNSGYDAQSQDISQMPTHIAYERSVGYYGQDLSALYENQDHGLSQHSFIQPPCDPASFTSSTATSPQSNSFHIPRTSPGSNYGWAPPLPVRSMSIADSEDLRHTYAAFRANTFPSFAQQMNPSIDAPRPSAATTLPAGIEHPTIPAGYRGQMAYYQSQANTSPTWPSSTAGHLLPTPVTSHEGYGHTWYGPPTGLPYVREEENVPDHRPFRTNPG